MNQHADVYAALMATTAILGALVQRATTGLGQHLDIAMGEVATYVNEWAAVGLQDPVADFGGFDTWNHPTYRLGDGTYVVLGGSPAIFWPVWARSLGADPELLADPRFATEESRAAHLSDLVGVIDSLTSRFATFEDLDAVLDEWTLAAHVRSVGDLAATDWAAHRGLTAEVLPGLRVPAAPWRTDGTPVGVHGAVARLGADNRGVLADYGYTAQAIADLERSGALSEPAR